MLQNNLHLCKLTYVSETFKNGPELNLRDSSLELCVYVVNQNANHNLYAFQLSMSETELNSITPIDSSESLQKFGNEEEYDSNFTYDILHSCHSPLSRNMPMEEQDHFLPRRRAR